MNKTEYHMGNFISDKKKMSKRIIRQLAVTHSTTTLVSNVRKRIINVCITLHNVITEIEIPLVITSMRIDWGLVLWY